MLNSVPLAQISTAADNLNVVVYGLLIVAALLALLTIWYWRHTKPRPLVVTQRVSEQAPGPISESPASDQFDPESVWAQPPPTSDDGIAFDDWLAITSPENGPKTT